MRLETISATKNFNTGAIIVTTKKQLLRHTDRKDRSTRFFAQLIPSTKILCFTIHFNQPDTPYVTLPVGASTYPCNTMFSGSTQLSISIGSAVFTHFTAESSYQRCNKGGQMGAVAPRRSRQGSAKQPHQKYFMTNDHKSEFDTAF